MSRVNFKNIAIFDKRLLPPSNNKISALIQKWGKTAFKAGMDACYLRLHGVDLEIVNLVIESLAKSLPKILPCSYDADFNEICGVHFKEHEEISSVPAHILKGKSCHSLELVKDAQDKGLDYVFFSPIFETQTHPEAAGVGLGVLEEICNSVQIPVFALGGVNKDNHQQCIDAGAHGIAAISMFRDK